MTTTDRIEAWLRSHRPGYLATLRPGVPTTDIEAFERSLGLALPEGARELYSWRDGQRDGAYESLVYNWMFPPLASVARQKRTLDDMIGYDFEDPAWWRRGWVPVFDNGGGDALCVDLTPEGRGRVLTFYHDAPERPVVAASLSGWLQALADAMESGAYGVY